MVKGVDYWGGWADLLGIEKRKRKIGSLILTTEIIPREKCRVCNIYLQKNCLNDICLKCSKQFNKIKDFVVFERALE